MKDKIAITLTFFMCTMHICAQVDTTQKVDLSLRTAYFPKERKQVINMPSKENVWIFLMAGQSNMAGRGQVMPQDTIPHSRVLALSKQLKWTIAKEPLHEYEPPRSGLDCGLSFGKKLLNNLGDSIHVALVPMAIGGSGVEHWLGDSLFREVRLYTNFKEKVRYASRYGTVKGILWSQGERNSKREDISDYKENLLLLFYRFRIDIDNPELPILMTEIGTKNTESKWIKNRIQINTILRKVAEEDPFIFLAKTSHMEMKSDKVHLSGKSQRALGEKFAEMYEKEVLRLEGNKQKEGAIIER